MMTQPGYETDELRTDEEMGKKNMKKCTLTTRAEWATIIATLLAIPALVISILTWVNTDRIENSISESQPIQMGVGIQNDSGVFVKRLDATHGDELLVQISFRNVSSSRMESIAAYVALPNGLEYVPGSTIVYNRTNPDGLQNDDGIADGWIDLGGYSSFDGRGRGSGSISFRVRVSDNDALFVPGANTLNMLAHVGGYIDSVIATDTHTAYAAVDVVFERP